MNDDGTLKRGCVVCGRHPLSDPTTILIRTTPKGDVGRWRCQEHGHVCSDGYPRLWPIEKCDCRAEGKEERR